MVTMSINFDKNFNRIDLFSCWRWGKHNANRLSNFKIYIIKKLNWRRITNWLISKPFEMDRSKFSAKKKWRRKIKTYIFIDWNGLEWIGMNCIRFELFMFFFTKHLMCLRVK